MSIFGEENALIDALKEFERNLPDFWLTVCSDNTVICGPHNGNTMSDDKKEFFCDYSMTRDIPESIRYVTRLASAASSGG